MITTNPRRSVALLAVAGLAIVLPVSVCGSDSAQSINAAPSHEAGGPAPSTDANEIWAVLQTLPAREVALLYAGFSAEVRDDLASIVHAVAGSGQG